MVKAGSRGSRGAWKPPGDLGAGSIYPDHLQEAHEGHQLKPNEPGSGAARGSGGEDAGGHDMGLIFIQDILFQLCTLFHIISRQLASLESYPFA